MAKYVDDEAKLPVRLFRQTDTHGKFYYIGKLQFPGSFNFEKGISFMVLVSEYDKTCPLCKESYKQSGEKLLIAPVRDSLDDTRTRRIGGARSSASNRLCVDLRPFTDSDGNTGYVGDAKCPTYLDATDGLFFTVFLSREGMEELQISRLDHNRRKARNEHQEELGYDPDSDDDDDNYDDSSEDDQRQGYRYAPR